MLNFKVLKIKKLTINGKNIKQQVRSYSSWKNVLANQECGFNLSLSGSNGPRDATPENSLQRLFYVLHCHCGFSTTVYFTHAHTFSVSSKVRCFQNLIYFFHFSTCSDNVPGIIGNTYFRSLLESRDSRIVCNLTYLTD